MFVHSSAVSSSVVPVAASAAVLVFHERLVDHWLKEDSYSLHFQKIASSSDSSSYHPDSDEPSSVGSSSSYHPVSDEHSSVDASSSFRSFVDENYCCWWCFDYFWNFVRSVKLCHSLLHRFLCPGH